MMYTFNYDILIIKQPWIISYSSEELLNTLKVIFSHAGSTELFSIGKWSRAIEVAFINIGIKDNFIPLAWNDSLLWFLTLDKNIIREPIAVYISHLPPHVFDSVKGQVVGNLTEKERRYTQTLDK